MRLEARKRSESFFHPPTREYIIFDDEIQNMRAKSGIVVQEHCCVDPYHVQARHDWTTQNKMLYLY
jgi:hypothetical protein